MLLIDSCAGRGQGQEAMVQSCARLVFGHSELHGPWGASGNMVITQVDYSDEKKLSELRKVTLDCVGILEILTREEKSGL